MESTDEHRAKRRMPSGSGRDADGVDLISGLDDDVLLHILRLLPSASDVARAGAVSGRWRHLSTRAPRLHFDIRIRPDAKPEDGARLMAFVDAVLARHADAEELEISFLTPCSPMSALYFPCIKSGNVDGWLRYGLLRAVNSFVLKLPQLLTEEVMVLDELPSHARLETMSLTLGMTSLKLPTTASFGALLDLSLGDIKFIDGNGNHLGRLLSSTCCPRLRKLHLERLVGVEELPLEAGVLEELGLLLMCQLRRLKVETPTLQVLHINSCFPSASVGTTATILAPRLEELAWGTSVPEQLEFDSGSSVQCLKNVDLKSHPIDSVRDNDFSVCLLQRCTSADHLNVFLEIPEAMELTVGQLEVELDHLMGGIPQLPHVTNLKVEVESWGGHTYGASVACLLARCSGLKNLYLDILNVHPTCSDPDCPCDRPTDWKDQKISLELLQVVEIKGFLGLESETGLLDLLLASAPALKRVQVMLSSLCCDRTKWMMKDCEELVLGMAGARGKWVAYREAHPACIKWTPH